MKKYIAVAITMLLWMGETMIAQPVIPRFEHLGVNNGLSQSSVYAIFQDKQGFMWFGTADGLNRYDGSSIKVYKLNSSTAANSNFIRGKICEDKNSNIWYCNETGIFCYNRRLDELEIKHAFHDYKQSSGVFIDSAQNFWMIHPVTGIGVFNISNKSYRHFPFDFKIDPADFISLTSISDADHYILFRQLRNGGFTRFNTLTHQYEQGFAGKTVHALFTYKDDYCLATADKLFLIDKSLKNNREIGHIKGREEISDMQPDAFGRLWIASIDSGLTSYNISNKEYTNYQHSNSRLKSLPFNLSTTLFIDRTNNLWIGSDGGGVSRLDLKPPRFNLLPLNEGDYPFLTDYFTRCFYEDEHQRIWFGTNSSGLNILNPTDGSIVNYRHQNGKPNTLPDNNVSCIFRDRDGNLWVSSSLGISIFNERAKQFNPIPLKLIQPLSASDVFVFSMTQLQNGDILAATLRGLVRIKNENHQYKGTSIRDETLGCNLTSIVEMKDGSIWLTAPINGLKHYKPYGAGYKQIDYLFNGMDLRSIHQDEVEPHILWVCSGIGLIKLNTITKQYVVYDEKDGMANSYIYGVLEDAQHNFWMSSNKGLIFFDRKENRFENFDANDGLQSNEFNTSAYYKGPSGTFYFGGVKGFNWFGSANKTTCFGTPGVAITSTEVNYQPYHFDSSFAATKSISLPYYKNNVNFQFAALDFTLPEANKIQYKLDGWDKQWTITSEKNTRYANLSPGKYTLRFKASNSSGQWSDEEIMYVIIKAPFWKTWWFYTLSILLLIGLVVFITQRLARQKLKEKIRELERKRELENERQRIGREMHDDIGAGLTQITLMSEAARRHLVPEKELDEIANTSRQLVSSMSEIIWSLNPENNSLDHLLSYLREQLHKLLEPSGIAYQINFPTDIPGISLNNMQRRNIVLTTKELVHNAIKHSQASQIIVEVLIEQDRMKIAVQDNGIGFDVHKNYQGNGLRNISKRIEDLGATLEMNSEQGTGSRFTCHLLLLNSHSVKNGQQ